MTNFTVAITSDPCYMGKKRLDKAIELYKKVYPGGRGDTFTDRLASIGRQHGITFSFAGKIGNTRDAHRLIAMSETKGPGVQDRLVMELFRDYFEADGDVTSYDTLLRVAEKAGLDRAEVLGWLKGGEGGEQVDAEVHRAGERNVTGVPSFIIQDNYEIGGAQDEQDFLELFIKVKAAEAV